MKVTIKKILREESLLSLFSSVRSLSLEIIFPGKCHTKLDDERIFKKCNFVIKFQFFTEKIQVI